MAEGTYAFECMRCELLGLENPDKEQFELAQAQQNAAKEEIEAEQASALVHDDERLIGTGGKLDELNSILSSTQQKLNRFKKTACGSLSNIFKGHSMDDVIHDEKKVKLDQALDNLDEIKTTQLTSDVQIARHASLDIQKKMTSHNHKLDSLIDNADRAEQRMSAQTKQMKKFI